MEKAGLGDHALSIALCLNPLTITETERGILVAALDVMTEGIWGAATPQPGGPRWVDFQKEVVAYAQKGAANDVFTKLLSKLDPREF